MGFWFYETTDSPDDWIQCDHCNKWAYRREVEKQECCTQAAADSMEDMYEGGVR